MSLIFGRRETMRGVYIWPIKNGPPQASTLEEVKKQKKKRNKTHTHTKKKRKTRCWKPGGESLRSGKGRWRRLPADSFFFFFFLATSKAEGGDPDHLVSCPCTPHIRESEERKTLTPFKTLLKYVIQTTHVCYVTHTSYWERSCYKDWSHWRVNTCFRQEEEDNRFSLLV